MGENYFAKALHNFTMDAAAGDAIRHLTDKGYTSVQIREVLTFPAPPEYIEKTMLLRLLETKKLTTNPVPMVHPATEIVEHRDKYGRKSFVRVKKESPEEIPYSPEDYVRYKNVWVIRSAQEQVSSLSDHILQTVRSTGSHPDM